MRIGIETMVYTILLCISCMILAHMIGSNLYILQARTCFHLLADQIEYSQNDEEVIEECKEKASDQGYRLESQRIDMEDGTSCVLLSLYYNVKLFGLGEVEAKGEMEGVIQGYAR